MAKIMCSFVLAFLITSLHAQVLPERMLGEKMINDFAGVIKNEDEAKLESKVQEFKENFSAKILVVLTKDLVKSNANKAASSVSNAWGLGDNSILILADVNQATYGVYVGDSLKEIYPDWVIQKMEHNYLKPNFRDKKYFAGLDEAINTLIGLKTGEVAPDDLRKDASNGMVLILIFAVLFFFLIFPILQFISMRKSHFSSKRMDFVSTIILMNSFGTRGKNVFDDFSKGEGRFSKPPIKDQLKDSFKGGGGIAGSW